MVVNRSTTSIMAEQRRSFFRGTISRMKETFTRCVKSIVGTDDEASSGTNLVQDSPKEMGTVITSTSQDRREENKFDIADVTMPDALTSKYDIGPVIGKGSFAFVLECTMKHTESKYALKVYKPNVRNKLEMKLENEISLLYSLSHPNIIRLYDDYRCNDYMFEIVELVNGAKHLKRRKKYKEDEAKGMLYNLVSALEYLHSKYIIHFDVKPDNILIMNHEDGTKSLKLGHFGFGEKMLFTDLSLRKSEYSAPEILEQSWFGPMNDVWSAGVMAYHLLSGRHPFNSPTGDAKEMSDLIIAGKYDFSDPAWTDVSDSAKTVIKGMLNKDPTERACASCVLDHPWMSSSGSDNTEATKFNRRYRASGKRHMHIIIIAA